MRLRSTAPPTCLLTVNPNRGAPGSTGGSAGVSRRLPSRTNAGVAQRAPERTRRNSGRRLSVVSRAPAAATGPALGPVPATGGTWDPIGDRTGCWAGGSAMRHDGRLRPTGACAPWPGGAPGCGGLRRSACACESRGGACGPAGSVDRCASRLLSRVEALGLHALGNRPESRYRARRGGAVLPRKPARIASPLIWGRHAPSQSAAIGSGRRTGPGLYPKRATAVRDGRAGQVSAAHRLPRPSMTKRVFTSCVERCPRAPNRAGPPLPATLGPATRENLATIVPRATGRGPG